MFRLTYLHSSRCNSTNDWAMIDSTELARPSNTESRWHGSGLCATSGGVCVALSSNEVKLSPNTSGARSKAATLTRIGHLVGKVRKSKKTAPHRANPTFADFEKVMECWEWAFFTRDGAKTIDARIEILDFSSISTHR